MYKLAVWLWRKAQIRTAESILIWAYKNTHELDLDGRGIVGVVRVDHLEKAIKSSFMPELKQDQPPRQHNVVVNNWLHRHDV